jgi:DNA polymerase-3 subunit gamma/tau
MSVQSTSPVKAFKRPGFSIRSKVDEESKSALGNRSISTASVAPSVQVEDLPVSEDGVRICWKQYAATLPKEQTAMAGRLLNLRPMLKDNLVIDIAIDNRMVATELSTMRSLIESYLRKQLQNSRLTVNIVVEETQTTQRIYSRVEQYQILEKRHPVLRKLKELLDLDLS